MSGFEIIDDSPALPVGEPNLVVALEKKGRGRGFAGIIARPWTSRTFKLKGQTLEYYDGDVLKGEKVTDCLFYSFGNNISSATPFRFYIDSWCKVFCT
jgi:hypothetical protein